MEQNKEYVKQNMFDVLYYNYQLFFEMEFGAVMKDFHEGKINFVPTYKRKLKNN